MHQERAAPAQRKDQVRRLVLAYLERLGARIEELGEDLFRAELSLSQAAEWEGGWAPLPGPWSPGAPQQVTYYFTFTPRVAEAHEGVELIALGSRRLDYVIASIRKIAGATRVWLPAPAWARHSAASSPAVLFYRPFFLFTLGLEFCNTPKPAEIARVAVDAVDQIALTQAGELLAALPLESGYPAGPEGASIEPAAADVDRAFEIAYESVAQLLEAQDPAWAARAQAAIDQERDRLIAYFAARERDGDDVAEERERRLGELEASRPGVVVRVRGVSEVFLPVLKERGIVRHLAFERSSYA